MKIKEELIPEISIEEFANQYNLTMVIGERTVSKDASNRYYAHFENAEIKESHLLSFSYGNGRTKEEAIKDYSRQISLKLIVLDAYKDTRKEIQVPRLK